MICILLNLESTFSIDCEGETLIKNLSFVFTHFSGMKSSLNMDKFRKFYFIVYVSKV